MTNLDSLQLVKEVVKLQDQIAVLSSLIMPAWQKNLLALTPLISAIISGIIGYVIAKKAFMLNKQKDDDVRIKTEEKEKRDLTIKYYGELFSIQQELVIYFEILNHYLGERRYFEVNAEKEKDADFQKDLIRLRDEYYNKYENTRSKAIDLFASFAGIIAKYYLMHPNSKIMKLYNELTEFNYTVEDPAYDKKMNDNKLQEIRDQHEINYKKYLETEINKRTFDITECIRMNE